MFHYEQKNRKVLSYRFTKTQFVKKTREESYKFFCDPYNLEEITPTSLSFKIKDVSKGGLKKGAVINYKLKLHGFPMQWQTIITEWADNHSFTDYQNSGPYTLWNHRHDFTEIKGGTLMEDEVLMRPPLKQLGWIVFPFVLKDVTNIFSFRREKIDNLIS